MMTTQLAGWLHCPLKLRSTVTATAYGLTMYSGLTYEKPTNSDWSRFIINTLSVGVKSVFSDVNCLSKLETSLRCFYNPDIMIQIQYSIQISLWLLTIFGLNGGCTSRFSIFSQSMRRKNGCTRTSSSPVAPQPKRLLGCLVKNCREKGRTILRGALGINEVSLTYALAGLFGLLAETLWIGYIVIGYGCKQLLLILAIEGRLTH